MNKIIVNVTLVVFFLMVVGCNPFKAYWYNEIVSSKYKESIFINVIGLGVTGDSRVVKISTTKDKSNKRKKNDYYLNSYCEVYFQYKNDTLFIATESKFQEPLNNIFKTPIVFEYFSTVKEKDSVVNTKYKKVSPYQ